LASSTLSVVRRLLLVAVLLAAVPAAALADTSPPAATTTTPAATTTTPVAPADPDVPAPPAKGLIADGVTIGGVAVGGMTTGQARAAIASAYQAPVTLKVGKKLVTAPANRLGLHVYVNNPVKVAYNVGRVPTAPTGDIPLKTKIVGTKVDSFLGELARSFNRQPVDAKAVLKHGAPFVWADVWGRKIDKPTARELIVGALQSPLRAPLAVPVKVVRPAVPARKLPDSILIDRGRHSLTLYRNNKVVKRFPVAVGQSIYPTPTGAFHIILMERNPWWYPPTYDAWAANLKPVPPGPSNPLGTRWMGLDAPGVGIHGTDAPASIGYSESHGCIRMQVPDAEWVFEHVDVGTPVWIVD
jgi:lipoprotein-anchoring transpeptidase ErfK/SrfK